METYSYEQAGEKIEQLKMYIKDRSDICEAIICYVDNSDESVEDNYSLLHNIRKTVEEKQVLTNKNEFWRFLKTVCYFSAEHQPTKDLIKKIENIIELFFKEIQQTFTQKEIFKIFGPKYRRLLLFLLERNIVGIETIHEQIKVLTKNKYAYLENCKTQCMTKYFFPEIREHDKEYFNKLIKNRDYTIKEFAEVSDQNIEMFYLLRKENENCSEICKMIREDKIEEFISYFETTKTDLNTTIKPDFIFERKSFLRQSAESSLIELSALFGSIKIFKYLFLNKVGFGLNNLIFDCAIQGRNSEIIHILEEIGDIKTDIVNNISDYLGRAILCFHNDIFRYLKYSYIFNNFSEIIEFTTTSGNYLMLNELIKEGDIDLSNDTILNLIFTLHCSIGNTEIVQLLIKMPNLDINYNKFVFGLFDLFIKNKEVTNSKILSNEIIKAK